MIFKSYPMPELPEDVKQKIAAENKRVTGDLKKGVIGFLVWIVLLVIGMQMMKTGTEFGLLGILLIGFVPGLLCGSMMVAIVGTTLTALISMGSMI